MADLNKWHLVVAAVTDEFARLSPPRRALAARYAADVKACKTSLHAIVERVAIGDICASCGGECCRTGKYHFRVVDLLVYLVDGKPLFVPRFGSGACPYGSEQGCFMEAAWRPYPCVTFNCDRVERFLGPEEKGRLGSLERELRLLYGRFEELLDPSFRGGLLMCLERNPPRPLRVFHDTGSDGRRSSCQP